VNLSLSLTLLVGCACTGSATSGTGGEPSWKQAMLDATNSVRANPQPAPNPPLSPLSWDDNLGSTAQSYANKCVFEHNANRGSLGENIAFFGPGGNPASDAVQVWAAEASNYTYASNSCASGQQCGHYTQLVWRSTTAVGCGMTHCQNLQLSDGSTVEGDFWVCDYNPPGNFVGQKPY
jgi:uncharacterized protein YkwD